jgi:putative heme degradation protein
VRRHNLIVEAAMLDMRAALNPDTAAQAIADAEIRRRWVAMMDRRLAR